MATTNLIPVHKGKDGMMSKAIRRIIGYVENPGKTENGSWVTGYACDPRTADAEFMMAKREYIQRTGRIRGKDDVIAYHLRQAFAPGEITPEEANRLGYELAKRFTHGENAFIVATHTDKHHVHNHIIISAVNLTCDYKFRDFHGSKKALGRLSDMICLENGYSIVEHPKGHKQSYNKWLGENYKRSQRDELREAIDIVLLQKPADMAAFLKMLEDMGWEIKRGKHISLRKPGQQRFKRMDSLGENYSEDALAAICKGNRQHAPKRNYRGLPRQNERLAMLSDIQNRMHQGRGPGYERWSKVFYLKQMAKTMLYLSENDLDYGSLVKQSEEAVTQTNALLAQINANDQRMKEIGELKRHISNYIKTREVYVSYREAGYSKKFAVAHADDLALHKAAKAYFDKLGTKKLPSIKSLSVEYEELIKKNKRLYGAYHKARDQMQQSLTAKANLDLMLHLDEQNKEKERGRENAR